MKREYKGILVFHNDFSFVKSFTERYIIPSSSLLLVGNDNKLYTLSEDVLPIQPSPFMYNNCYAKYYELTTPPKTTKKQYIPTKNEDYFYVDLANENLFGVATWLNDATDYHMLKLGLIFDNPQECVKKAKEMLRKLDLEV